MQNNQEDKWLVKSRLPTRNQQGRKSGSRGGNHQIFDITSDKSSPNEAGASGSTSTAAATTESVTVEHDGAHAAMQSSSESRDAGSGCDTNIETVIEGAASLRVNTNVHTPLPRLSLGDSGRESASPSPLQASKPQSFDWEQHPEVNSSAPTVSSSKRAQSSHDQRTATAEVPNGREDKHVKQARDQARSSSSPAHRQDTVISSDSRAGHQRNEPSSRSRSESTNRHRHDNGDEAVTRRERVPSSRGRQVVDDRRYRRRSNGVSDVMIYDYINAARNQAIARSNASRRASLPNHAQPHERYEQSVGQMRDFNGASNTHGGFNNAWLEGRQNRSYDQAFQNRAQQPHVWVQNQNYAPYNSDDFSIPHSFARTQRGYSSCSTQAQRQHMNSVQQRMSNLMHEQGNGFSHSAQSRSNRSQGIEDVQRRQPTNVGRRRHSLATSGNIQHRFDRNITQNVHGQQDNRQYCNVPQMAYDRRYSLDQRIEMHRQRHRTNNRTAQNSHLSNRQINAYHCTAETGQMNRNEAAQNAQQNHRSSGNGASHSRASSNSGPSQSSDCTTFRQRSQHDGASHAEMQRLMEESQSRVQTFHRNPPSTREQVGRPNESSANSNNGSDTQISTSQLNPNASPYRSNIQSEIQEEMARARSMSLPVNLDSGTTNAPENANDGLNPNAEEFAPVLSDGNGNTFTMTSDKGVCFFRPRPGQIVSDPRYVIQRETDLGSNPSRSRPRSLYTYADYLKRPDLYSDATTPFQDQYEHNQQLTNTLNLHPMQQVNPANGTIHIPHPGFVFPLTQCVENANTFAPAPAPMFNPINPMTVIPAPNHPSFPQPPIAHHPNGYQMLVYPQNPNQRSDIQNTQNVPPMTQVIPQPLIVPNPMQAPNNAPQAVSIPAMQNVPLPMHTMPFAPPQPILNPLPQMQNANAPLHFHPATTIPQINIPEFPQYIHPSSFNGYVYNVQMPLEQSLSQPLAESLQQPKDQPSKITSEDIQEKDSKSNNALKVPSLQDKIKKTLEEVRSSLGPKEKTTYNSQSGVKENEQNLLENEIQSLRQRLELCQQQGKVDILQKVASEIPKPYRNVLENLFLVIKSKAASNGIDSSGSDSRPVQNDFSHEQTTVSEMGTIAEVNSAEERTDSGQETDNQTEGSTPCQDNLPSSNNGEVLCTVERGAASGEETTGNEETNISDTNQTSPTEAVQSPSMPLTVSETQSPNQAQSSARRPPTDSDQTSTDQISTQALTDNSQRRPSNLRSRRQLLNPANGSRSPAFDRVDIARRIGLFENLRK